MQLKKPCFRYSRGNVLFIILLSIVLFSALNFIVTNSIRGDGKSSSSESSSAAASEIIQHVTLLEQTITRLRLSNGCDISQLSFWYDSNGDLSETSADVYYNSNAPVSRKCHIFAPEGGGLARQQVPDRYLDTTHIGKTTQGYGEYRINPYTQVTNIGSTCTDDPCVDLIVYINYVTQDICKELAKTTKYPISTSGSPIVVYITHYFERFKGDLTYIDDNDRIIGPLDNGGTVKIDGFNSGCFYRTGGATADRGYTFYHVLLAR